MNKSSKILIVVLSILVIFCSMKEPQDPEMVFSQFKNEESLDKKIDLFEIFKVTNPDDELLQTMLSGIINGIKKDKDFIKAGNYLKGNSDLASSRMYNSIAWSIFESKENLEMGSELAKEGAALARKELETSNESKPENRTEEEWNNSKKQSLAMILDTYGCLERELGNRDNALSIFQEAVNLTNEEFGEVNENYVSVMVEQGDYSTAQTLLDKYISSGTDSKNMKSLLKEVFTSQGNSIDKYETHLKQLEEKARKKMITRLKDEIKNEVAPEFKLFDLDGNSVKLSDYKGKTIILDFWATWCGPCLQSFPAMVKAVEKLSKNSNVEFLFANTWERVDDKKQNAIEFINENKYPFHVLLDDENQVVEKYKVRGIPTKFIIDKNQNIRFESVGFSGKEDELIDELEIMVEMIN